MESNFCVFILSHGRPDHVITYTTLKRCGYSGKVYFIVDNEDITAYKYIKNFGADKVIIFNKKEMADSIDEANNFDNRKVIVHARNFCFIAAEILGIEYFWQLDDDYKNFHHRFLSKDKTKLMSVELSGKVFNINYVIDRFLEYYKNSPFTSIAFAQGGDFLGGAQNDLIAQDIRFKRKCMNSFFLSTKRPFKFVGGINEDVNTYTYLQSIGLLFITLTIISLVQLETQQNKGGMTDTYKLSGTYVKSFTTVLYMPSSVKVAMMQSNKPRLHHSVKWTNTVPCIINQKYKKI